MTFRVHIESAFIERDIRLFILQERPGFPTAIVTGMSLTSTEPGVADPPDAGKIINGQVGESQKQFVQAILDAAWEYGMRPSGYSNVAEGLRASDAHLQDMRAIAFGKLGVTKP